MTAITQQNHSLTKPFSGAAFRYVVSRPCAPWMARSSLQGWIYGESANDKPKGSSKTEAALKKWTLGFVINLTKPSGLVFAFLLLSFGLASPVLAGSKVELSAGLEYDSNVSLEEADLTKRAGDSARELSLGLGYDYKKQHLSLSGFYQLQDSRWQRFSEFNSQVHLGLLRGAYQLGAQGVDISLAQAYGRVDGKEFLNLTRLSPAYGVFFSNKWYLRSQIDLSQKDFPDYAKRNSDALAASLYLYRFLDGSRFYLSTNLQVKEEKAVDGIYSYQAGLITLQAKRDWTLFQLKLRQRLKARYETRQYQDTRADIKAARADERYRLSLENELVLSKNWQLGLSLQQDWLQSNLPVADYDQWRAAISLEWGF